MYVFVILPTRSMTDFVVVTSMSRGVVGYVAAFWVGFLYSIYMSIIMGISALSTIPLINPTLFGAINLEGSVYDRKVVEHSYPDIIFKASF